MARRSRVGCRLVGDLIDTAAAALGPVHPLCAAGSGTRCAACACVTPCWWWSVPALLKGFIDRVFLPGFGVEYLDHFPCIRTVMKGRSARVIYTQNSPQWMAVLAREDRFWRSMRRGFLGHCGFGPIRRTLFASMERASPRTREGWLREVHELGRRGL